MCGISILFRHRISIRLYSIFAAYHLAKAFSLPANTNIEYFKGTEAQTFFEKIKEKKIKVSYKPQQVDLIPKTQSGKVIDELYLLAKMGICQGKNFTGATDEAQVICLSIDTNFF